MALKTVLDTLDGVDDALKAHYAETDGRFVLQVDGVDNHPEVENLRNAYAAEKQKRQTQGQELADTKAQLAAFPADFDLEKWKNAGKADPQDLVNLRVQLEGERDEARAELATVKADTQKQAVRNAVQKALADQNVPEGARRGAALDMMDGKKVELQDGKPMIETDMGPMPIGEYAKRWVAKDGKGYVPPAQGGGGKGNGGDTASKKFSDLTGQELVALRRENPQEYDRLKAAG